LLRKLQSISKLLKTFRNSILLLFTVSVFSCSDNESKKHLQNISEKHFGISIENGPRQGFQYFDSARCEYDYRYVTTTITNDSIVPVHLEIYFSEEYNSLRTHDSLNSKVFLLPRALTPKRQHFDGSMSKELKDFLDTEIDTPISLDTTINPKEECVIRFGVLTDIEYVDPMRIALITSIKNRSALSLQLSIDNGLIIPCGQISFSTK